jgi:hypothetical protein
MDPRYTFCGTSHKVCLSLQNTLISFVTGPPTLTRKGSPYYALQQQHPTQPQGAPAQIQHGASYRPTVPSGSEMPDEWGYDTSRTAQVSSVPSFCVNCELERVLMRPGIDRRTKLCARRFSSDRARSSWGSTTLSFSRADGPYMSISELPPSCD